MNKIRKIASVGLILLGVTLILYPWAKRSYEEYNQQRLLSQWQESLSLIDSQEGEDESETGDGLVNEDAGGEQSPSLLPDYHPDQTSPSGLAGELASDSPADTASQDEKAKAEYIRQHVEGILRIEKIKLELPILKNATKQNLQLSVSSIEGTERAGEIGNYSIAGHRNRTFGRNFNRLDELQPGDRIEVETKDYTFIYEVYEKLYVLPNEVWVLKGDGINSDISLITCHPMKNPTHRLVVKGRLLSNTE